MLVCILSTNDDCPISEKIEDSATPFPGAVTEGHD